MERVATPPLDGKILDSITRKVVLEILTQQNVKILEMPGFIEPNQFPCRIVYCLDHA